MKLELEEVRKSFGDKQVLRGISLTAESGRAFGLLGRNGAGKTTTIRILMNVFHPDSGRVLLDGKPIDYEKIRFGYLPEERGLYPKRQVLDQLVYFAVLRGMPRSEAVRSVRRWLRRLGMETYADKRLDTLSKGNQQKIQLITAIAHDPDVVILDEPFSGLDPVNAKLLKDVVCETIEQGKLVFFSSHQMNYIEEFCDHIAILNGGSLVLSGELRAIRRSYPRDRLLVRSPECSRISEEWGGTALADGGVLLRLSSPDDKGQVMQALSQRYELDEVKVYEPSLNDIFVEYTGKEERYETVERGPAI